MARKPEQDPSLQERLFRLPPEPRHLLVVAAANEAAAVLSALGLTQAPPTDLPGGPAARHRTLGFGDTFLKAHLTPWSLLHLPDFDLLISGVGKANASGAVVHAASAEPYESIINLGIAGSLPNTVRTGAIGEVILATSSCFADEGVQTPSGFTALAKLGFASCPDGSDALEPDPGLAERLASLAEIRGIIATVSTCSGTDELATQVASRTHAVAEAMEGAAVLLAAAHLAIPAAELRVISNTTGDRSNQIWDIKLALARLGKLACDITRVARQPPSTPARRPRGTF